MNFKNGLTASLAFDYSLSEAKSQSDWREKELYYSTKSLPKYGVQASIEWNGMFKAYDSDGDGIKNNDDKCINEVEDFDGYQDEDGCPEPDNDKDGILDKYDECPNTPVICNGCPVEDMDKDGLFGEADKCPRKPEDLDGYEDEDGCPEPDNDLDGIKDVDDLCPMLPEDADNFKDSDGCPDYDNDEDGLPDSTDLCPDTKGLAENEGCSQFDKDKDGILDSLDKCPNSAGPLSSAGCPQLQVPDEFEDDMELEENCPDLRRRITETKPGTPEFMELDKRYQEACVILLPLKGQRQKQPPPPDLPPKKTKEK
ncbi:MAG: thrombospondin type 3 repeat-containing protein [Fibrobacteria bacterium]|nr:thrombospondin type 3 repeat-containing protein [Fibrobacteria bacterium]